MSADISASTLWDILTGKDALLRRIADGKNKTEHAPVRHKRHCGGAEKRVY